MQIRVNTICPGIFPSEMTGVNSNSDREGHNYDMGDAANKAAARSTAGESSWQTLSIKTLQRNRVVTRVKRSRTRIWLSV